MSRSRRLPIYKDHSFGNRKYRRIVRRSIKNKLRACIATIPDYDIILLPSPKNIVNDWDRCDYKYDMRFDEDDEDKKRAMRK